MRTTVTLDPDVAELLDEAVHRERRPTKQVINDALRRGLATHVTTAQPYRVTPHVAAVRPGFDPSGFNRLVDELEDEAIVGTMRRKP